MLLFKPNEHHVQLQPPNEPLCCCSNQTKPNVLLTACPSEFALISSAFSAISIKCSLVDATSFGAVLNAVFCYRRYWLPMKWHHSCPIVAPLNSHQYCYQCLASFQWNVLVRWLLLSSFLLQAVKTVSCRKLFAGGQELPSSDLLTNALLV